MASLLEKLNQALSRWLMHEKKETPSPLCDFERARYELRPCDVILVEGRSRVSDIIKAITQSSWSHAALYVGRIHDIDNPILRKRLEEFYKGSPDEQLIIESLLGQGTVVSPLTHYEHDHIRICRPKGISRHDAQQVIGFAIGRLGSQYGIRHLFDLARFLLPWSIMPRHWRSTLFEYHAGTSTHEICSYMLAEAFAAVRFPLLPVIKQNEKGLELFARNPKLYTPRDFDYSPYFEIIKYPFFELSNPVYRDLPWNAEGIVSSDALGLQSPKPKEPDPSSASHDEKKTLQNIFKKEKKHPGIASDKEEKNHE